PSGAGRRAPEDPTGVGVHGPVLPALLAGAHDVAPLAVDDRSEQLRAGAEIPVRPWADRAVVRWEARQAPAVPVVEHLRARRPFDGARPQVEGEDRVHVVVRIQALARRAAGLLALLGLPRDRVVVARRHVEPPALDVDHGRPAPDRGAAVAARLSPVVGDGVGLPEKFACLRVYRHDTAPERAAGVI